MIITEVK